MQVEPIRSAGAAGDERLSGLVRSRYSLVVCVVCAREDDVYECAQRRQMRAVCGATIRSFRLWRELDPLPGFDG